jgi:hypothetical protein
MTDNLKAKFLLIGVDEEVIEAYEKLENMGMNIKMEKLEKIMESIRVNSKNASDIDRLAQFYVALSDKDQFETFVNSTRE